MNYDDFENRVLAFDWKPYEESGFGSIPEVIIGLARASSEKRHIWCDRLELCLLPHASLGNGSPYAIPYLLELLIENVACECIYSIFSLAVICTEDPKSSELGVECRNKIRMGLDTYLKDLKNTGLSVRERSAALGVICRLSEDRLIWEPIVKKVYEAEYNLEVKNEIREWLFDLENGLS